MGESEIEGRPVSRIRQGSILCYDEAVKALRKELSIKKTDGWRTRLSTVFNRGFWDGYYLGQTMENGTANYGSSATKRKVI